MSSKQGLDLFAKLSKAKWGRRLEGWSNTARLAMWIVEESDPVRFCSWWTVHAACPDDPYRMPLSRAAQLRASGDPSCCLLVYVHKTPTWLKSHIVCRVIFPVTDTASLAKQNMCCVFIPVLWSRNIFLSAPALDPTLASRSPKYELLLQLRPRLRIVL